MIVFGLTLPGLESGLNYTRGGHANYYNTDAVLFPDKQISKITMLSVTFKYYFNFMINDNLYIIDGGSFM